MEGEHPIVIGKGSKEEKIDKDEGDIEEGDYEKEDEEVIYTIWNFIQYIINIKKNIKEYY